MININQEFIGNIVLPDRIIYAGKIVCESGIITEIRESNGNKNTEKLPFILPGLIDIHNHGAMGYDYMEATDEAFDVITKYLARHGVTTAQCTTASAPVELILPVFDTFRKQSEYTDRCRLCSIHLEGPFISPKSRGAHQLQVLKKPKDGYDWILENKDIIGEITVAPELNEMPEMIQRLTEAGIIVSGGHDDSETEDIIKAVAAGMTHCTHIYCAMSTLHKTNGQRKSGLCEYAMIHDDFTVEMIADEHHIPPQLAQMIYRCKGPNKLCMVSDAIAPSGLPESENLYSLGTGEACTKVRMEGGVALVEDRSCYAGSIQALDQMIANVVRNSNIPFVDAVRMASLTPAQVIGIDKECGSIQVGKRADFCFMDCDFKVIKTIIAGRSII